MRWCAPFLSVSVLLSGCLATVDDTGSLRARVTRLENRVNGMEQGVAKSSSGADQLRGSFEQRMTTLQRDQQYLRKDLDELSKALTRLEETASGIRIEVTRLKDRFDQIESGALAREKNMSTQVQSVAGLGDQFRLELDELRRQALDASTKAQEADARSKSVLADLSERMKLLDREVQALYNDLMKELSGGGKTATDGVHVVQTGETLGGIAARYGVRLDALLKANPQITDARLIRPGDKIKIPS